MENTIILQSNIKNGPISTRKDFYPEGMSSDEIKKDLYERRMKLGQEYGFDGRKMMIPVQKSLKERCKYPDGKYVVLNDCPEVYRDDVDLWDYDYDTDIMVMKQGLDGVMMGYPSADCPVIIMQDRKTKTLAFAHCSADCIDRELPMMIADSLNQVSNTKDEDILVYVGPMASSKNYAYNNYPKWATNDKIWKYCIKEKNGLFYIDLRRAIIMELALRNIQYGNVEISNIDTITDPAYYSNHATYQGAVNKNGRILVGALFLNDKDMVKTYGVKFR